MMMRRIIIKEYMMMQNMNAPQMQFNNMQSGLFVRKAQDLSDETVQNKDTSI